MRAADNTHADAPPVVSIVIPTFNRLGDLRRTMDALFAQAVPARDFEIIVVDNSSSDGTREWVESLHGAGHLNVRYVRKEPEGPAAARNVGIENARGEFVLFVDSDVVLNPGWIAGALAAMRADADLACLGGAVVYAHAPARLNAFGGDISPIGLAWDTAEGRPIAEADAPRDCLWLNCSAMLARTAVLRELGGFDAVYFYGYEDSDLGWRVNLAGHRVRVLPSLVVTHHVGMSAGASDPRIVFHYTKNRIRSLIKNYSLLYVCSYGVASIAITLADGLLRAPHSAKLKAVAWNVGNLGSTLRARRAVQTHRRRRDSELSPLFTQAWLPPTRLAGRRRRPAEEDAATVLPAIPARDDRVN